MAPTKKDADKGEKEAKLTPEQSAALMLDYLRKQNRPYSATDISANLKNRVTKAAAAKLLKDMHERNEIEGRAAGKQIVYHAIQGAFDEGKAGKLQEMEAQTTSLKDATTALKAEEKELRLALREGVAQVPLPELKASVTAMEHQKAGLSGRLAELQGGNVKPVSLKDREQVDADHRRWKKSANARNKIRMEMWEGICVHLDDDKIEETKEALGLEF